MAYHYIDKTGKERTLLTPAERGRKYADELKSGKDKYTGQELSARQKAYRAGYNKSRSDNAKAFNHNVKKGDIVVGGKYKNRLATIIFKKKG